MTLGANLERAIKREGWQVNEGMHFSHFAMAIVNNRDGIPPQITY